MVNKNIASLRCIKTPLYYTATNVANYNFKTDYLDSAAYIQKLITVSNIYC